MARVSANALVNILANGLEADIPGIGPLVPGLLEAGSLLAGSLLAGSLLADLAESAEIDYDMTAALSLKILLGVNLASISEYSG